jgi:colanic acid biosynthesis glycosyl transferase WcaI
MKVLIIAQYFPPDMGGGATRAYNAAKGLARNNCRVTIVSAVPHYPTGNIPRKYRWKPLSIQYDGEMKVLRTFVFPLPSEGLLRRVLLFASFVVSSVFALPFVGKVDVVWAANPNIISFYPSFVYGIVKRCRLVQNVDDLWPEALYDLGVSDKSFIARFGELMARTAYRFAVFITPISLDHVSTITTKYQIKRGKICVIPAGVDLDKFTYKQKVSSPRKLTVLYIGAFSPAYDFDQVFKAAKLLAPFPDIEFVIQGGGELAAILHSKVKRWELSNVKIVDMIVSRDEVARTLNEAWVVLLPLNSSVEMGISSKLYEYQAAGKPIICCSKGQQGRYVSETESGIVVKPGDYEALAKTVLYLRENPDVADRMGECGRRYVENNLSTDEIGLKIKKLFEAITQKRSAKHH